MLHIFQTATGIFYKIPCPCNLSMISSIGEKSGGPSIPDPTLSPSCGRAHWPVEFPHSSITYNRSRNR